MPEAIYSEKFRIVGNDYEHGGEVATYVKKVLKEFGLTADVVRRLSIANFEAEMNVVMYARAAEFDLEVFLDSVRIVIADEGPGIPDIDLAMQEGYSTATAEMRQRGFGAGLGLPNIKRNTDELQISSVPGKGTTLRYAVFFNR